MKKILFPLAALFVGSFVNAQEMFALTGKNTPNIVFSDFRPVNFEKGKSGTPFFDTNSVPTVYSEVRRMTVTEDKNSFNHAQASAMATLAVSATGKEIFYMPLYSTNIYAMDLDTQKITLIEAKGIDTKSCDLNTHFTRMTSGADGNIYALTNSGSQLLQIVKKNSSYQVNNLGAVADAASNGENSLKIMQSGFGGDMVADANGDLYIFAASGNVFRVAPKKMTAEFMGKISSLPADFSLNGAAVSADGKVVIASAKAKGYYLVNMENLAAIRIENSENLHIYDLASRYLVNDHRVSAETVSGIQIYPTMVTEKYFNLNLSQSKLKGNMTLEIFNSGGQPAMKRTVVAGGRTPEHKIEVGDLVSGMYLVTLKNESGEQLLAQRIIVK